MIKPEDEIVSTYHRRFVSLQFIRILFPAFPCVASGLCLSQFLRGIIRKRYQSPIIPIKGNTNPNYVVLGPRLPDPIP
jgi:hypothetical protein